ncbi:Sir2 family NAD-dependent protein deacetylase [Nocardioides jishulii]|uniref:protein acetyllysine N-acetyltransferase n=1 Tax=Nocardioides jishulii TaxID=2575440 RepID=A0A4U2YSV1_9ACTN|nr:Sir2 family NAD-dependent protein deacetylase [Nocardioides jishulii]QCX28559.1 NAD-dependent deacetylase [Nocardioides jishulii]TKI64548.1 NAD-dependent deacetylase [Nocardioides jishulii]
MTEQLVTHHEVGPAYAAALDVLAGRRLVVLTGAGLSTDSGIPDYRGPGSTARMPMTYSEFVGSARARQRYWARSHVGWSRMRGAHPNAGHLALARIDPELLITQNVDGLHEAAGSQRVVALHGRIDEVVCLACGSVQPRADLHARLDELNPGWLVAHSAVETLPDGDVELDDTDDFVVPDCARCGGVLKPHVVFFGENAPKEKVRRCFEAVDALSDPEPDRRGALLVAGSSLTVMSGLRFVKRAARDDLPVVVVNRGATRGDDLATLTVHAGTSEFLTDLARRRGR